MDGNKSERRREQENFVIGKNTHRKGGKRNKKKTALIWEGGEEGGKGNKESNEKEGRKKLKKMEK